MNEKNKKIPDMQDAIEAQSEIFFSYVGKRLMEKRAEEYDRIAGESKDFKVPREVHDRLVRMIAEEKRKAFRTVWSRRMKKAIKVCSIAILVAIVTSTILITTVDAFRYRFENFLVQIRQQDIKLTPNSGIQERPAGIPADWHGFWYPEYLPEGFSFDQALDIVDSKTMLFKKDIDDIIKFTQSSAEGSQIYLDNEADQNGEIELSGQYVGHWIMNNGELLLIWLQQDNIMEITARFDINEVEKIAESLEYFK
ncbi:MAG: DUF4367 domain-containing protein [Anaerovoracaceae bacterium]